LVFLCILAKHLVAQTDTSLQEVVVHSFQQQVKWKEAAASVAVISSKELDRFSIPSLVPVFNTVAGVRMEERSPGSYRIAIRGNLLRSPFGVRNLKIYWNGLPIADATGNSYFNLLDLSQINNIEITKGPASSMYGAGTSGAILLEQPLSFANQPKQQFTIGISGGSFKTQQQQAGWQYSDSNFSSHLQFHHIASDGYREQTAMNRTGVNWQTRWQHQHTIWQTLLWYTRLQYQTPGGLTAAQMLENPAAARPPAGTIPGAVQQKAGIINETVMAALQMQHQYNERVQLKGFFQLNNTKFSNPFITNYELRNEKNINGGSQIIVTPFMQKRLLKWITGFEYLINESGIQNFQNNGGNKGVMMSNDIVYSTQAFLFSQLSATISTDLTINLGFSTNKQVYEYKRLSDVNPIFQRRSIDAPFVPRFSANYAITKDLHIYGVIAKGFSVPSLAEVRPSDGNFYPFLQAEQGWNYELGLKGTLFHEAFTFDMNGYRFLLQQAIVRKTNAAGAEYFVNAGSVLQQGIEASLKWKTNSDITIFTSFSYQPYTFQQYSSGATQYDGNTVTGVPGTIWVSGADWQLPYQFILHASVNATSSIPLNDANTAYANAYQLVQAKLSKTITTAKRKLTCYIAADNLLNQSYSLGNDINAVGGRFFNPSPTRNFYAGIHITFNQ
jgi:iron complex outermembrane receptor protein